MEFLLRFWLEDIHHEIINQHDEIVFSIFQVLLCAGYGDLIGLIFQGKVDCYIELAFDSGNGPCLASIEFDRHPIVNIQFYRELRLQFLHNVQVFLISCMIPILERKF